MEENARRGRNQPPINLLDSGAFADNRYFDVQVEYAKAAPDKIHIRIIAANRGPERATLHLLPKLWWRNTWSWGDPAREKPELATEPVTSGWSIRASGGDLGEYRLYGEGSAELLFTENESNIARLLVRQQCVALRQGRLPPPLGIGWNWRVARNARYSSS